MNKRNFFVVALLGLSFCIEANLALAEPQPLVLPEQGLVLPGQEKIQCMTDKLNSFFHPQKQSDQSGFMFGRLPTLIGFKRWTFRKIALEFKYPNQPV